ncbi:MAG: TetR/AcrR family transcriptional regulator [Treponema sp.]|nr:TetR/AcrR family transcriptional regulator [Treponema sp.]
MGAKVSKDDIIRALLDTAFFRSTGATSLKDIAEKIGIKKASLYNHFESRDDIIKQTMDSCREYVEAIMFTPRDIDSVTKKYPPDIVFKGIINRYFKMHEKTPLFQIYTFLESQKYFSQDAVDIIKGENRKIIAQTIQVLKALKANGRISIDMKQIDSAAVWFCSGMKELLNLYLLDKKKIVVNNPDSGEGQLFSLPADETALEKIDTYIDSFIDLIAQKGKHV